MEDRDATLTLRIEGSLKATFDELCRKADRTPSQIVRGMIRQYVTATLAAQQQGELELPGASRKPKKGQRMAEASKRSLHRD